MGSGTTFGGIRPVDLDNGANHLIAVQIKSNGDVFISVDGVDGASGLAYGSIIRTDVYDRLVAGGFKEPATTGSNMFDGVLSHIWFKRTAVMPDWSHVWSAGNGNTETTTARFTRLCALLGLSGTILGSSTTQISSQAAGGKTPAAALRDVAAVEAGLVYASRASADVVFETRAHRYNKASSLTLTTTDIGGDLTWSDDDQPLVNDVTNQREGGADQRVKDQASIDAYGVYTGGSSQAWATDADALAAAQWEVYLGADPPPRVTQVRCPASTLAIHTSVLALDLSDVITLTGLPATSPETSVELFVEGYQEDITEGLHSITFNTSPAEPYQVWQIGVPGHSEIGVTTRIGL
nr:hypothetical protein GCM10020093_084380 [Planobispora longispora]